MGDPTLRSHPPIPVSNLTAGLAGNQVVLSWSNPSTESNRLGCRIYRSSEVFGPFVRIGAQTGAGATGITDAPPHPGRWYYMVRSVKRQATASASYDNLSQGIVAEIVVPEAGYAEWSAGLSDPSETADSNGDGVPNLLAYAMGASSGMIPATLLLPRQDSEGFLVPFSGIAEVGYEVQRSLDLSNWHRVALKAPGDAWTLNAASGYLYQHQISMTLPGGRAVRFSDTSGPDPGFWRLRVTR